MRVAAALLLSAATATAHALPTFDEVRASHRPSDAVVVDRTGVPLQTVRVDKAVRRLAWVPLADVSPALQDAVVASEDKRFHTHAGVDWQAVARSAWSNATGTKTRGASTLTMQLAGLLDEDLARPRGGRSLGQKVGQAVTAARLERAWTKDQILEAYLNRVPFRGELEGVGALAETLFSKHPSGLDAQEAAVAAALLRSPNAAADAVASRACGVVVLVGGPRDGACDGVKGLVAQAFAQKGRPALGERLAPHLARRAVAAAFGTPDATNGATGGARPDATRAAGNEAVKVADRDAPKGAAQRLAAGDAPKGAARGLAAGDPPDRIATTLSAPLQRLAARTLRARLAELGGRNVEDGAVLVLDNATGDVLAWVGSSGPGLSDAADVDAVVQRRQPGSTLKPFVYALALERGLVTAATPVDDSPAEIGTAGGAYVPQNYDKRFHGPVSVRAALGASLNVPAVRVGGMVGVDALHGRLNALGFGLEKPAGWYGASLALGSADVTLLALTNAYRTLANGGLASPVAWRPDAPRAAPARVLDARAAAVVADILADDNARARTFGWGSALATRGWAAVKTGTSKDMRDNWCIGFTDRVTIGVWVGNASGHAMHGVSGTDGAAPVWHALAAAVHANAVSKAPVLPAGVERRRVAFEGGREPPRDELFLAGTANADGLVRTVAATGAARPSGIVAPRDGSVFALDPDIPPHVQRLSFEGEAGRWVLDGRVIGSGSGSGSSIRWSPWPGRHRLELVEPTTGRVIDRVAFEVRGAGVRRGATAPGAPRQPGSTRSSAKSMTSAQTL